jgi:hypothetical protein
MSAELIFATDNDFAQGERQGICTAAAMNWAMKVLENGRVDRFDEIGLDVHTLNIQMATMRKLDNDPEQQCDRVGLQMVSNIGNQDWKIGSVQDVIRLGKDNPDKVIIFGPTNTRWPIATKPTTRNSLILRLDCTARKRPTKFRRR